MKLKLINFSRKFITNEYLSWLNDKDLTKHSRLRLKKNTKKDAFKYLASMKNNFYFAVIYNKEHVGNVAAYIDWYNSCADLSIILKKQGFGYGLSSLKVLIKKLKQKKIRKITCSTMIINKPMIKLCLNLNMKLEYIKKKQLKFKYKFVDLVGYYKFL